MTKILADDVYHVVTDPSMINSGIPGNCYLEFISYGGGDGSSLVIVLAAEHVTTLMAEIDGRCKCHRLPSRSYPVRLATSWRLVFAGCLSGSNRKPLVESCLQGRSLHSPTESRSVLSCDLRLHPS